MTYPREHLEAIEWECTHPRGKNALPSPYQIAQIIYHKRMALAILDAEEAFAIQCEAQLMMCRAGLVPDPEPPA